MNTQVTLLAIPTPNGVFLRWEDGVTDNPRVVTAGYAGEEERGYDAIFGTTGKGESFDPLDDDNVQPGNPSDPDPSNPIPKPNPNPDPTIFSPQPTILCGKSVGINFYNKTCVTDPDGKGQEIVYGWKVVEK